MYDQTIKHSRTSMLDHLMTIGDLLRNGLCWMLGDKHFGVRDLNKTGDKEGKARE